MNRGKVRRLHASNAPYDPYAPYALRAPCGRTLSSGRSWGLWWNNGAGGQRAALDGPGTPFNVVLRSDVQMLGGSSYRASHIALARSSAPAEIVMGSGKHLMVTSGSTSRMTAQGQSGGKDGATRVCVARLLRCSLARAADEPCGGRWQGQSSKQHGSNQIRRYQLEG